MNICAYTKLKKHLFISWINYVKIGISLFLKSNLLFIDKFSLSAYLWDSFKSLYHTKVIHWLMNIPPMQVWITTLDFPPYCWEMSFFIKSFGDKSHFRIPPDREVVTFESKTHHRKELDEVISRWWYKKSKFTSIMRCWLYPCIHSGRMFEYFLKKHICTKFI